MPRRFDIITFNASFFKYKITFSNSEHAHTQKGVILDQNQLLNS